MNRKKTRKIMVGDVPVGGDAPVTVQSMTNTLTSDVDATIEQIRELECAGCQIIRVAVPDIESADALERIVAQARVPVIADIHFDRHSLAMLAMEHGVAGIRINPGTIGNKSRLIDIAHEATYRNISVRVGVNSGSLEPRFRDAGELMEAEALAMSALQGVEIMEANGVNNIKISVKASSVTRTIEAYRMVSEKSDWPLHVGVTEAGTVRSGTIKSAVGIGSLLAEGIGDTIRVSLSGPPVEEVRVGRKILSALGLSAAGVEVISCPTCARTEIDVIGIANRLEDVLESCEGDVTVAVMGCAVNGPGEVRNADVGVAGSAKGPMLFIDGKMVRRIDDDSIIGELVKEVKRLAQERSGG